AGLGIVHDTKWFIAPGRLLSLYARHASPHHPGLTALPARTPLFPGATSRCQCALTTPADPLYHRVDTIRWLRSGHRQCPALGRRLHQLRALADLSAYAGQRAQARGVVLAKRAIPSISCSSARDVADAEPVVPGWRMAVNDLFE